MPTANLDTLVQNLNSAMIPAESKPPENGNGQEDADESSPSTPKARNAILAALAEKYNAGKKHTVDALLLAVMGAIYNTSESGAVVKRSLSVINSLVWDRNRLSKKDTRTVVTENSRYIKLDASSSHERVSLTAAGRKVCASVFGTAGKDETAFRDVVISPAVANVPEEAPAATTEAAPADAPVQASEPAQDSTPAPAAEFDDQDDCQDVLPAEPTPEELLKARLTELAGDVSDEVMSTVIACLTLLLSSPPKRRRSGGGTRGPRPLKEGAVRIEDIVQGQWFRFANDRLCLAIRDTGTRLRFVQERDGAWHLSNRAYGAQVYLACRPDDEDVVKKAVRAIGTGRIGQEVRALIDAA